MINIEKMAKDQLKDFLDENTNTANLVDFFGPIYRTKPDQFAFSCGDNKMVQQLSEFVKSTVRVNGYEYFQGKDRPCNANVKRHIGTARNGASPTSRATI